MVGICFNQVCEANELNGKLRWAKTVNVQQLEYRNLSIKMCIAFSSKALKLFVNSNIIGFQFGQKYATAHARWNIVGRLGLLWDGWQTSRGHFC